MSINESELHDVEWVDVEQRRAVIAPEVMALRVLRSSHSPDERRGTPTPGALRWFLERDIKRIRVRFSSDGRFIALEGSDATGSAIRQRGRSQACQIALPPDLRVGATIALSPFGRTLIGLYPHDTPKEETV